MLAARRPASSASRAFVRRFSTAESAGVSVTARDDQRPVSQLSLVVKAGSRYQPAPGVARVLEKFAYRNTEERSALRLVRETELLGGQLSTQLNRENLVLTAKFLREDLPYFVKALGDVAKSTVFRPHELVEDVAPLTKLEYSIVRSSKPDVVAMEAAHEAVFRKGLGNSLYANLDVTPVTLDAVKTFGKEAYTKSNVKLVASGVVPDDLNDLVEKHFKHLSSGAALESPASTFYAGEARIPAPESTGDSVVLAFPVKPSPVNTVIANVLGAVNPVKWSVGHNPLAVAAAKSGATFKAQVHSYSDADLITITVNGDSTSVVRSGAQEVARVIKEAGASVNDDAVKRAVAQATFANLARSEVDIVSAALAPAVDYSTIKTQDVKSALESLAKGKVALGAVGQVHELPYLDELF